MKIFGNFYSLAVGFFVALGNLTAAEKENSSPIGIYFGGFGGFGFVQPNIAQKGTAFPSEAAGGALAVNASGEAKTSYFGFGGLHIGYEWVNKNEKNWSLVPAVEFEGYYYANTVKANLENPTTRLDLHTFKDSFPARTGVFIADAILAFNNKYLVPYIGAGVGAAMISIHNADCLQTDPLEANVNHFNSDPKAYASSFATQVKAGLRYPVLNYMRLFIEYRYLYLFPVNFLFGSTDFPTHVTTSPWNVRFTNLQDSLFSLGIDFTF